jgi:RND family efflux transporter MFP subunit
MHTHIRRPVAFGALGLLVAGLLTLAWPVLSCRGRQTPDGASGSAEPGGTPAAKKTSYRCPMHPTMVADRPGDCPVCGMRMLPIDEQARASPTSEAVPVARPGPRKIIYRSTMNPNEISDRPGKDSMGMEMVPIEVEAGAAGEPGVEGQAAVRIPSRKQQLIGVRTSAVVRAPFVRTIRTVGRVTEDETRLHHAHSKTAGWIETLYVNTTGERVRKGQPLLTIYSPELLATQEEYLLALKARRDLDEDRLPEAARRADELLASTRRRLLLFDLTPAQIDELERSGTPSKNVTLYSDVSGYVTKRNVTQGEKIDGGTTLLDIADLSRVWVLASVYEYELPFVKAGQAADMTLSYLPGKTYRGRVALVYPVLEGATRTVQVRLEFPNPDLLLKPEMFADVRLQSDLGERLAVPESAVLSSGTRSIVFVAKGEGYFEPREVRLGLRLPDAVEILDGLADGESIVTSGNFLIDSESKLKAALEAAAAPKPAEAQKH